VVLANKQRFLEPAELVAHLSILPGARIADVGCGNGHLVAELAKATGEEGIVYAVDQSEEAVSQASMYVRKEGMANAAFLLGDFLTDPMPAIDKGSLDWIVFGNFFYVLDRTHFHLIPRRALTLLKPEGKLLIIEWRKGKSILGPPAEQRIAEGEMRQFIESHGFHLTQTVGAGSHHYALVFEHANRPQQETKSDDTPAQS